MNTLTDWLADMDAWQLTPEQRDHHYLRLHAYHRRVADRLEAEDVRLARQFRLLGLGLCIASTAGVVQCLWAVLR